MSDVNIPSNWSFVSMRQQLREKQNLRCNKPRRQVEERRWRMHSLAVHYFGKGEATESNERKGSKERSSIKGFLLSSSLFWSSASYRKLLRNIHASAVCGAYRILWSPSWISILLNELKGNKRAFLDTRRTLSMTGRVSFAFLLSTFIREKFSSFGWNFWCLQCSERSLHLPLCPFSRRRKKSRNLSLKNVKKRAEEGKIKAVGGKN